MPPNPRAHFGILSAEILPASQLLPLIDTMTLDQQIVVVGKLRSLEVVLLERIMHQDTWHPHHAILAIHDSPKKRQAAFQQARTRQVSEKPPKKSLKAGTRAQTNTHLLPCEASREAEMLHADDSACFAACVGVVIAHWQKNRYPPSAAS